MNFAQIGIVHENAHSISRDGLWLENAEFPELSKFDLARKALAKSIKAASLSGSWSDIVDQLAVLHARLARTPCRPSWLFKQEGIESIRSLLIPRLLGRIQTVDPTVRVAFESMVRTVEELSGIESSPVAVSAGRLLSTFKKDSNNLVILRSQRLWDEAKLQLSANGGSSKFEIRKPVELRQHPTADNIIILGPPWVLRFRNESFLLGSPLASSIWFVACGHEHMGSVPQSLLDDDAAHPLNGDERPETAEHFSLDHEPLYASPEISFILKKGQDSLLPWLEDSEEKVAAVPVILGGGKGIYLEEGAIVYSPSVEVIEEQRVCLSLEKRMIADLEPGMLVLLTTEGGGEMIPVVADAILKHQASRIRNLQKLWKSKLIEQVESHGLAEVAELLQTSTANIKNWCHPRNIAPENLEEHLRPLLDLSGLKTRYEEIVQSITRLRSAHQSAGMKLQALLLKSLGGLDLRAAFLHGYQDIRDPAGGPIKTVYLVQNILETEYLSARLVGRVWDLEVDL